MDLKKTMTIIMNIGLSVSALFGLGHFFIPYIFKWYSYMPDVPRYIIVSIDWTNFFFSLLLLGNSILLLINQNKIIQKERATLSFYGFLLFTYLCKVVIIIVEPWNIEYQIIDMIQTAMSLLEFLLLLIPFIYFCKKTKEFTSDLKNINI